MVSVGSIVGLVFAVFFAILVLVLALVLLKVGKVLDEATTLVGTLSDRSGPLLGEVRESVVRTNTLLDGVGVTVAKTNGEIDRLDTIVTNVGSLSTNVTALTSLFAATVANPVVKIAAFSYGVRRAAGRRDKSDMEKQAKAAVKAERRESRGGR